MTTGTGPVAVARAGALPAAARAALRIVALAATVAALAAVHLRRPPTICPLRALTGLPCPFCGGTTAAVDVGRLDPVRALRANPLVVVGVGIGALAPRRLAQWWIIQPRPIRVALITAALICGELWQLIRFGILPT